MSEEQNQGLASAATEAAEQEENKKQRRGRGKSQQAAEAQGDEPQEDEAQDGGESQADEAQDGGGETQDGDKQDTETSGSETAQSNPPADKVQNSGSDKKPSAKNVPQVLYGKLITAANLCALAGVNKGVFPFTLALNSHDGSALPFPELGNQAAANLLPYAQNVAVTFANQNMLETFVLNVNRFAELWDWDEQRGVTVSPYQEKD